VVVLAGAVFTEVPHSGLVPCFAFVFFWEPVFHSDPNGPGCFSGQMLKLCWLMKKWKDTKQLILIASLMK